MFTRTVRLVLCCLPLLLTGCVLFQGQSVTYRYDRDRDELRLFLVYEGVCAGEGMDAKEQEQFRSVVNGRRAFFFNNWITEYNGGELEKQLAELKAKVKDAAPGEAEEMRAGIALLQAVTDSVRVENGVFYLGEGKRLCAYQGVTVARVTPLLARINGYVNSKLPSAQLDNLSPAAREKALGFARGGRWVELSGNRLTFRFLLPPKDSADVAQWVGRVKLRDGGTPVSDRLSYEEPFVTLVVGREGDRTTRVEADDLFPGSEYNNSVLDHVRKNSSVREGLDIDRIRDRFLDSGELARPGN